ncbi:hypothetical protein Dimus_026532, partial [Dionaea muscipula]
LSRNLSSSPTVPQNPAAAQIRGERRGGFPATEGEGSKVGVVGDQRATSEGDHLHRLKPEASREQGENWEENLIHVGRAASLIHLKP